MKKRGVIYIPFLMVLILIFGFVINSNYIIRNIEVYLDYENISEIHKIDAIDKFISQLEFYKDDYYNKVDLEFIDGGVTFLDYVKNNNLKLFKGNFYILDFILGNKVNPNNDKIVFYYSTENREGYYFYVKEHGRNIDLNIARVFRV